MKAAVESSSFTEISATSSKDTPSSVRIRPRPTLFRRTPLDGRESCTWNCSANSIASSPSTVTVMSWDNSPGRKVTVPEAAV